MPPKKHQKTHSQDFQPSMLLNYLSLRNPPNNSKTPSMKIQLDSKQKNLIQQFTSSTAASHQVHESPQPKTIQHLLTHNIPIKSNSQAQQSKQNNTNEQPAYSIGPPPTQKNAPGIGQLKQQKSAHQLQINNHHQIQNQNQNLIGQIGQIRSNNQQLQYNKILSAFSTPKQATLSISKQASELYLQLQPNQIPQQQHILRPDSSSSKLSHFKTQPHSHQGSLSKVSINVNVEEFQKRFQDSLQSKIEDQPQESSRKQPSKGENLLNQKPQNQVKQENKEETRNQAHQQQFQPKQLSKLGQRKASEDISLKISQFEHQLKTIKSQNNLLAFQDKKQMSKLQETNKPSSQSSAIQLNDQNLQQQINITLCYTNFQKESTCKSNLESTKESYNTFELQIEEIQIFN